MFSSGLGACKCLVERSKREIARNGGDKAVETVRRYRALIEMALERHTLCKCKPKK